MLGYLKTRTMAKGQALLLGGLAATVVLCACLSLIAFAMLCLAFVAFIFWDDHSAGGADWSVPAVFLTAALTVSLVAASRFGWKVGQDWYRNGR